MTSPYVTFPGRSTAQRVLLGTAAASVLLLAGFGAALAAFVAKILWTGCFIECSQPNHLGGALLAALAVASLTSGPAAVSGIYRSAAWMWAAFGTGLVGAVLAFLWIAAP